jgi:hypothetical protein
MAKRTGPPVFRQLQLARPVCPPKEVPLCKSQAGTLQIARWESRCQKGARLAFIQKTNGEDMTFWWMNPR